MRGDSRYLPLKDKSVNCIITSPPYWSLRKYDIPDLIWDGDEGCEHNFKMELKKWHSDRGDGPKKEVFDDSFQVNGTKHGFCSKCGAWQGQLGLEPQIDLYLKHLLQIMDECKRVLRDDGTMWVNLGDSYAGSWGNYGSREGGQRELKEDRFDRPGVTPQDFLPGTVNCGISPKSLCLIPERFAIEMVNRGWILRNKLIWHKPNCMPSSAKDRFTVDFEPIFFFVKSKKYWFEQQYEENLGTGHYRKDGTSGGPESETKFKNMVLGHPGFRKKFDNPQGHNRRCVWTIPTQPYPESHFATFPEALVEPMIKAGCPQFVCKKCGKAREKIVERRQTEDELPAISDTRKPLHGPTYSRHRSKIQGGQSLVSGEIQQIGLTDCGCNAGFEGGIVLDPFCGSGTVLKVAEKLQRKGIGIDLGYQELAEKRTKWNQVELSP